jgi:quercetin dioxygenase-like cupin family protein
MALTHAHTGEVIHLRMPPQAPSTDMSCSLLRTPHMQLMRLVLPAGHVMPPHHVHGEMAIQCLDGEVEIDMPPTVSRLHPGDLVVLAGDQRHTVRASRDTVLLLTLLHATAH